MIKARKRYWEHTEEEEKKERDEKVERIIRNNGRERLGEGKWADMSTKEKTYNPTSLMKEAQEELKEEPKKERKVLFSEATEEILERRAKAIERGEQEEYERLTNKNKN